MICIHFVMHTKKQRKTSITSNYPVGVETVTSHRLFVCSDLLLRCQFCHASYNFRHFCWNTFPVHPPLLITMTCCTTKIGSLNNEGKGELQTDTDWWIICDIERNVPTQSDRNCRSWLMLMFLFCYDVKRVLCVN